MSNFKIIRVLVLGHPLGSLGKKCHLDVGFVENHKVSCREGNVSPFKSCKPCKACV
jgi:hypothetical protein